VFNGECKAKIVRPPEAARCAFGSLLKDIAKSHERARGDRSLKGAALAESETGSVTLTRFERVYLAR
jgi:hypothetical protein